MNTDFTVQGMVEPIRTEFERRLKAETGREDWTVTARIGIFNYQFDCMCGEFKRRAPSMDVFSEPEWNARVEQGLAAVASVWWRER